MRTTMRRAAWVALALFVSIYGAAAHAADPQPVRAAADGEWISLTGRVKSVDDGGFTIEHDDSRLAVVTKDRTWLEGHSLRVGDRLTVTGVMDRDFFELRKLHASSIYVARLNTWFYAGPAEEEDGYYSHPATNYARNDPVVSLTGSVVRSRNGSLILDVGIRELEVDMRDLPAPPDLRAGERVTVSGELDDADLFEGQEMEASSVIRLTPN